MSGSTSETVSILNKTFSSPDITSSSTDDLLHALAAYVQKHTGQDDSTRIQEELRKVYSNYVEAYPEKLGPFVTVLKNIRPSLSLKDNIPEWFTTAVFPVLSQPVVKDTHIHDAQDFLLESLVYDPNAVTAQDNAKSSASLCRLVIQEYLRCVQSSVTGGGTSDAQTQTQTIQRLQSMIIAYGRKQPKDLFQTMDDFILRRETRFDAFQLLSAWLQHQHPHLDTITQTPVIEHLLVCLMNDRSTLLVSTALQCLVMLLPHIPVTVSTQLPRLFLIYSRCLCWEKFSASSSKAQKDLVTDDRVRRGSDSETEQLFSIDPSWKVITSVSGSSESSAPHLLSYFTYLYGLYPLNFMNYIRKPRKYLKRIDFLGADNFDLDQAVIRSRTEQYQQAHLLHPSFFNSTPEEELADNKWLKAEPAEVVAECLALYTGDQPIPSLPGPPPTNRLPALPSNASQSKSPAAPSGGSSISLTNIWRNIAARPEIERPSFQSPGSNAGASSVVETYGADDDRSDVAASIQPRPEVSTDATYLQRELQIIRNELVFERYLKQQHVAAIGQLKRERIKAVTMEAETATLINSNKALQKRLNDAHAFNEKMQKETQARKAHTRQSEDQLTAKIRTLRSGLAEQTAMETSLRKAQTDVDQLRQLLVESEARELRTREEHDDRVEELEKLKAAMEDLRSQLQELQERQNKSEDDQEETETLRRNLEVARAQVVGRDQERERSKQVFQAKVADLEARLALAENGDGDQLEDMTDLHNRLADAQTKQLSMERAWAKANHELQDMKLRYEELLATTGLSGDSYVTSSLPSRPMAPDQALSSNDGVQQGRMGADMWQGPPVGQTYQHSDVYAIPQQYGHGPPGAMNIQGFPANRPLRTEVYERRLQNYSPLSRSEGSYASPYLETGWERSITPSNSASGTSIAGSGLRREGSQSAFSFGSDDASVNSEERKKIQAKSEVRVYGRGGAQNIKLKAKDKDVDKTDKPTKSGISTLKGMLSRD